MKLNFKQKALVASVSGLLTLGIATSIPTAYASDIEIYKLPDAQQKTIMLMLDTSGSMSVNPVGHSACDIPNVTNIQDLARDITNADGTKGRQTYGQRLTFANGRQLDIQPKEGHAGWLVNSDGGFKDATPQTPNAFHGRWCVIDNVRYYDRMTKLKSALVDVVKSTKLDDSVFMGVGTFYADHVKDNSSVGGRQGQVGGQIRIPARPLTQTQRDLIYNMIRSDSFGGSGGTPSANAYAEVAAYLLGTTTVASPSKYTLLSDNDPAALISPARSTSQQHWVQHPSNQQYYLCGRKDATPSQPGDTLDILNIDATGACTGVQGSTYTRSAQDLIRANPNFRVEPCRGLNGNGEVWFGGGIGNARTNCLYNSDPNTFVRTPASYYAGVHGNFVAEGSAFDKSVVESKTASLDKYQSPLPEEGKECSGQAIYFLTDGFPNNAWYPQGLMKQALGTTHGDGFPMDNYTNTLGLNNQYVGDRFNNAAEALAIRKDSTRSTDILQSGWMQIGEFSRRLRDPNRNPAGVSIPTAVVGYGGDFSIFEDKKFYKEIVDEEGATHRHYDCEAITANGGSHHAKYACQWGSKRSNDFPTNGGYGEGGFYYAKDGSDVVDSILEVVSNIKVEFPDVVTGAPTVPLDALNSRQFMPYAYYASFRPQPGAQQQLWVGNVNKYRMINGVMVDKDRDDQTLTANGQLNPAVSGYWGTGSGDTSGVLGMLPLRLITASDGKVTDFGRKVLTNRKIKSESGVFLAENTGELKRIDYKELYSDSGAFANDPKKNYWLNVLGLNVTESATVTEANLPTQPELRQLAATMHSSPILLTQSATFEQDGATVKSRDDYVLFGTTDGVLHVVDNEKGIEKFAFVPNEMMEKQPKAFLTDQSAGAEGSNNLYYGADAPWVVHTQFVPTRVDGNPGLTVKDATLTDDSNDNGSLSVKGFQWAYGGLRMGGKSYYALDLSDIEQPTLKFHIDPVNSKIYSGTTSKSYPELANMGQSWSKPALAYVNWKGTRKLVMFVGGGYDGDTVVAGEPVKKGYEVTNYVQTNKQGAGVYMFDADDGSLLWWASADNVDRPSEGVAHTRSTHLQYSVVSRINTIDRNSDGLTDHLYFGDLGGQGFRVDFDNSTDASTFGLRVNRIFNEYKPNGLSPRFYEMPSVSRHTDPTSKQRLLVASFASGDKSSPYFAGTTRTATGGVVTKPTAQDGVFVYYDHDVATGAAATEGTLALLDFDTGVPLKSGTTFNRGWKYIQAGPAGSYKAVGEPTALASVLTVSVYNQNGAGITQKCGAGVRGDTELQRFCLPTGKCETVHGNIVPYVTNSDGKKVPASSFTGAGIVTATLGGGDSNNTVIVRGGPTPNDCDTEEKRRTNTLCENVGVPASIKNLRWFESR